MATNASFGAQTGGLEVAETYASNVKGKTILITGVSKDGIGEATARAFAHGGASLVIITGRDNGRLASITETLAAEYPNTKTLPHKLDLNTLATSQQSAQALLSNAAVPQIDILVANAGGTFGKSRSTTPDGLETHFGVNHVGHFVFINTLLPKLTKPTTHGATRIVVVSSLACLVSSVRFADLNLEDKPVPEEEKPNWTILKALINVDQHEGYDAEVAYGQSKTANVLFAVHLNRLYASKGIYTFALHPGAVQSRAAKAMLGKKTKEEIDAMAIKFNKSIDQGAGTTLVAALDPGLNPENGVFLSDCQIFEQVPGYAVDAKLAEKLWNLSEEIVKEKLSG
ncbi:retinol dehydrogenase 12 [Ophiobolus disseminans]|uniref:Retinol dehydrogenase 12 n=1 Tax=Ophiobolus disseminans TaxID=1469910 RepID=A0A6A6ZZU7_9PLEO|nr:retinol dehydrogenase 12 [Ophiobolus disseminans]